MPSGVSISYERPREAKDLFKRNAMTTPWQVQVRQFSSLLVAL